MMFFTSLLISLPYSSMRVTSRDGCSLIFTKTFYIMLRFSRIVQHGSSFLGSIFQHLQGAPYLHSLLLQPFVLLKRIPQKPVNSFLFVCSRWCKNSSPVFPLAYKSTAAFASTLFTEHTAKAVVNLLQSSHNCICFCCFSLFVMFTF